MRQGCRIADAQIHRCRQDWRGYGQYIDGNRVNGGAERTRIGHGDIICTCGRDADDLLALARAPVVSKSLGRRQQGRAALADGHIWAQFDGG